VDTSFSLLLELMDSLKGYGSDVVVIGGWAPYFLLKSFSHATEEHVGSLDADLALNFRGIPEEAYETLLETICRLGYGQRKNTAGKSIPASFEKTVTVGSVPYVMQVDFLAGEYGGNAKSHRHQRVQDMLAHKARGADVVFDQFYPEDLKGRLLNGAELTADGSGSRVSHTKERTGHSPALPSARTTRQGARTGGVSRLCAAGDAQASAEARRFGILAGERAEAARRVIQCGHRAAHRRRTRDLVAAHYKLDDEQQQILYQLQLPLPERLEPIQILKCSENSAMA